MSDISFDQIPSDVRVPLAYIEFNNSNAVGGTPAPRQRVLMFGQRSADTDGKQTQRNGLPASAATAAEAAASRKVNGFRICARVPVAA